MANMIATVKEFQLAFGKEIENEASPIKLISVHDLQ